MTIFTNTEARNRTAHAVITQKGRALNFLFARLNRVLDSQNKGWDEDDDLKSVCA